jgi:hypothetical protein
LTFAGYKVTMADSVRKALGLIRTHEYAVAVVDVMMPPGEELGQAETWGGAALPTDPPRLSHFFSLFFPLFEKVPIS